MIFFYFYLITICLMYGFLAVAFESVPGDRPNSWLLLGASAVWPVILGIVLVFGLAGVDGD